MHRLLRQHIDDDRAFSHDAQNNIACRKTFSSQALSNRELLLTKKITVLM